MSAIPHYMHIYQKPYLRQTLGSETFFARYQAYNYSHSIKAMGGYDTAECMIDIDRSEAEQFISSYMGNRVAIYVDNPAVPAWEGYINRVTIETGNIVLTYSLDQMANVVYVAYTTTSAAPQSQLTANATNLESGFVYGFKTRAFDIGNQYTTGAGLATAIRDKAILDLAYPLLSTAQGESPRFQVTVSMLGFWHWWEWDAFQVTNTSVDVAGNLVFYYVFNTTPPLVISVTGFNSSRITGVGGVPYNDQDFSLWTANPAFSGTLEKRVGETHWSKIQSIVEGGDGTNKWVIGVTATDPNLGYRRAYYRQANTEIEYLTNAYGDRKIYNLYGQEVMPWNVQPDRSIRVSDILLGFTGNTTRDIPVAYISAVEYDAESQTVKWQTEDDISTTGVFQVGKGLRSTDTRFGSTQRMVWF